MNYQESRDYIDKITREIPSVLGLDHMRELMKRIKTLKALQKVGAKH